MFTLLGEVAVAIQLISHFSGREAGPAEEIDRAEAPKKITSKTSKLPGPIARGANGGLQAATRGRVSVPFLLEQIGRGQLVK